MCPPFSGKRRIHHEDSAYRSQGGRRLAQSRAGGWAEWLAHYFLPGAIIHTGQLYRELAFIFGGEPLKFF